jgi:transcriptional regulator with GAF, ATPase, and Fis domain
MRNFLAPFSRALSRKDPVKPAGEVGSGRVSAAVLEKENQRLRRAVEELSVLNELALAIGAFAEPQDIVQELVDTLMSTVKAEQAVVTLVDPVASEPMRTSVRVMASSLEHQQFRMNEILLGWMFLHKTPLLTNDPRNDDRLKGFEWDEAIRAIMCVPLMLKKELIGTLTICNKKGGDYRQPGCPHYR